MSCFLAFTVFAPEFADSFWKRWKHLLLHHLFRLRYLRRSFLIFPSSRRLSLPAFCEFQFPLPVLSAIRCLLLATATIRPTVVFMIDYFLLFNTQFHRRQQSFLFFFLRLLLSFPVDIIFRNC